MKKNFFLLILTIAFVGCIENNTKVIDGCEYIETTMFNGEHLDVELTHKGNCKNPIHGNKVKADTLLPNKFIIEK